MGGLVVILLMLAGIVVGVRALRYYEARSEHLAEVQLRNELLTADDKLAEEFGRARRAMNGAAGQSWRDLAG